MIDYISSQGYKCILGNIYPHDVKFGLIQGYGSSAYLSWYVQQRAHPGSIVILHDGKSYLSPDVTLDSLLPAMTQQGYEWITVSQAERKCQQ